MKDSTGMALCESRPVWLQTTSMLYRRGREIVVVQPSSRTTTTNFSSPPPNPPPRGGGLKSYFRACLPHWGTA